MSDHTHHSSAHGSFREHQKGEHLRDELQNTTKKEIPIEKLKTLFA